tara:strand:+ start:94 stop:225 length:132 start_codon:yes stop_codon:yes gene_type:complete
MVKRTIDKIGSSRKPLNKVVNGPISHKKINCNPKTDRKSQVII